MSRRYIPVIVILLHVFILGGGCNDKKSKKSSSGNIAIATEVIPSPIENRSYTFRLEAASGTAPYTWSLDNGALPSGIVLDCSTGVLSGTTVEAGGRGITIGVRDSAGRTGSRDFTLTVRALPEWTVMVYLDGDNNLENATLSNLNAMEKVGSTDNVNIVVQFDRISGYSGAAGDWTDTRRFLVTCDGDNDSISSALVSSPGQLDMSSGATLSDFVIWAVHAFPARKYALVLNDHGSGWEGLLEDETTGLGGIMTLAGFQTALLNVKAELGTNIDLLVFDACLMGSFELFALCSPYADYAAASEETMPICGLDYHSTLSALTSDPGMTPAEFAVQWVTDYDSNTDDAALTASAVDLGNISTVLTCLSSLYSAVGTDTDDVTAVSMAQFSAPSYPMPLYRYNIYGEGLYVDLGAMGRILSEIGSGTVSLAGSELSDAVEGAVLATASHEVSPYSYGISAYFPQDGSRYSYYESQYQSLYMLPGLAGCMWWAYLSGHYSVLSGAPGATITSFTVVENTCDYSENQSIEFNVSLYSDKCRWIQGTVLMENGSSDFLWACPVFMNTTIIFSDGQTTLYPGWTGVNAMRWDGYVWALDNGTHTARQTVLPADGNMGVAYGTYRTGSSSYDYATYFNIDNGMMYGMLEETGQYSDFQPGMVVMPEMIDTSASYSPIDPGITVPSGGLTLKKVRLPAGTYILRLEAQDFSYVTRDSEEMIITIQD